MCDGMCSACGAEGAKSRAARSSEHAPHGELWIVVAVDDVMRDSGVAGILRLQLFEDIGGLELLGICLVGRVSRFVECQRIENCRLGVIGIARPQSRHRRFVVCRAPLLRDARVVLVVGGQRLDPSDLALGFLRSRARFFDRLPATLEDITGERADQRIGPLADRDAPIGHGARRFLLCNGSERLHGLGKEEGMLHSDGAIELLLRRRAA